MNSSNKKSVRNIFIGVFVAILLYCGLMQTDKVLSIFNAVKKMLSPFIVGGVIAFILNVPMRLFEKMLGKIKNFGLRRTLAITLTFVFVALIIGVVILLLVPAITETTADLGPTLKKFFTEDLVDWANSVVKKYPQLKSIFSSFVDGGIKWDSIIMQLLGFLGTGVGAVLTGITSVASFLGTLLMDVFVTVVFAVYCLSQKEVLARQGRKLLYACLRENHADEIVRILRMTNSTFSNFLSGQCIEVVILGSMFAVSMAIFKMDYIALISVLIAMTAFIPIVGAWIGCIVGAFLMLVTSPIQAVWFVVLFLVLQQIENHLIYPKVVGNSIGLSGMWVLIAVAVGGAVFGVAGMFLMIPVTSVIYTLISEKTNKKVAKKAIDPEKLKPQPPELKSKYKEKREIRKSLKNGSKNTETEE